MSGLVLKLSPKERVLINGAVVENGDRRSRISILTPSANILRLKDAIHPEKATTPVSRVCYTIQLVLSGDLDEESATPEVLDQIQALSQVFSDLDNQNLLAEAKNAVLEENFYRSLKCLKRLLSYEAQVLSRTRA